MSRLEKIKNADYDLLKNFERFNSDYFWLLEQAETVRKVELILTCADLDDEAKMQNIRYLFFNE